ncbi:MAG: cellulase [Verrucomicrobia bacterium]|nr:MAG: cellulase [Verrucomicrobiota bacterium]
MTCTPVAARGYPCQSIYGMSAAALWRMRKFVLCALLLGAVPGLWAQNQTIYDDTLESGWSNWSWATVNLNNTNPFHTGTDSISVSCGAYQALYLHQVPFNSSGYTNLTFWINGGSNGGQSLQVQATLGSNTNGVPQTAVPVTAPTNSWKQVSISLTALGVANQPNMNGFWIQSTLNGTLPTFYVDDITLVAGSNGPPVTNIVVSVGIDAQANRKSISPFIYGTAFASSNQLADLNFTLNRSGGNEETTYNWQNNAHGKGADWYFESYPDSSATPGATSDDFVANSKVGGAAALITLPMIGWAPKIGAGRAILWSYSVAKYGPQTGDDPYRTDAGNGISTTNSTAITWNDPNDANFPTNTAFTQSYVQHLMQQWDASTNGGVRYYILDNEHSIWHSTHQDVHPVGATMQEIWMKMVATAGMVKSNDPNALVAGPEEWGWNGYFYSGYDQQHWGSFADRGTNGGWDYMPWLLNQFHGYETNSGKRLLDYFTLHCYPQEGNVGTSDTSAGTVQLRNQSTRQFWDTGYVDPSWINSVIMLIPRMKSWVSTYYPGTKIGVTEYNWGAESDISGATAQADLLGIFGREGLDLATRWTTPNTGTPTYNAMKIYRNYDGNKSTFGDTSILASSPNPDTVAVFAALRSSDAALTLMLINKQLGVSATATINLTNFPSTGTGQLWQLTSANSITRLSDISFSGTTFTSTVPAQSITLLVLPAVTLAGQAGNPTPTNAATGVATNTALSWTAGTNATSHQLYFGANSNSVAIATTNSPEFKGSLSVTTFAPGPLAASGRFYWRVDEMAAANTNKGPIWTFATLVNSAAAFPVAGTLGSNHNFVITFPSAIGQTYRLDGTATFQPSAWQPITNNVPGTGSTISITDTNSSGQTQRFYRLVILPP